MSSGVAMLSGHCCQSLSLEERKLAGKLGLRCGPDSCAARSLSTFMVRDGEPSTPAVVDTEGRAVASEVLALPPLRLALVAFVGDSIPRVTCQFCDTPTSPFTCSRGSTRLTLQGWS